MGPLYYFFLSISYFVNDFWLRVPLEVIGFLEIILAVKNLILQQSRGCLGCCSNPSLIIAIDQPSTGLKIQGRMANKPSISGGFWSTSPCEVDNNSAAQSLRSVSSMSTSNPPIDVHTSGSTSNPIEFVNHGLLLWNHLRQQWSANKSPQKPKQVQESKLSSSATYESLLGTNKPFSQPIPLPEMVAFLVDVWEEEGLYD